MPDYTEQQLRQFMEKKLAEGVPKEEVFAFLDELQGPRVSQFEGAMPGEPPLITAKQPAPAPAPPKAGFLSRTWDAAKGAASGVKDLALAVSGDEQAIGRVGTGIMEMGRKMWDATADPSVPVHTGLIRTAGTPILNVENLKQDAKDENYSALAGDVLLPTAMGLAGTPKGRAAVTRTASAAPRLAAQGVGATLQDTGKFLFTPPLVRTVAKPLGNKLHAWGVAPKVEGRIADLEGAVADLPDVRYAEKMKDAQLTAKLPEEKLALRQLKNRLDADRAATTDPIKQKVEVEQAHQQANNLLADDLLVEESARLEREKNLARLQEEAMAESTSPARATPTPDDVPVGGRSLSSMPPRAQETIRATMARDAAPARATPTPPPAVTRTAQPRTPNSPIDDIATQEKIARDLGDVLSANDVSWLQENAGLTGLKPGMNITKLNPKIKAALLKARASRAAIHHDAAVNTRRYNQETQGDRLGSDPQELP